MRPVVEVRTPMPRPQLPRRRDEPVDYVRTVANSLDVGERILINDRSSPFLVKEREQDIGFTPRGGQPSEYPYHIIWLLGNGRTYRMRWSATQDTPPRLHARGELTLETRRGEQQFVATEPGEPVWRIRDSDVDGRDEQTDRVLARLIEFDG